jgi:hypothetical protein
MDDTDEERDGWVADGELQRYSGFETDRDTDSSAGEGAVSGGLRRPTRRALLRAGALALGGATAGCPSPFGSGGPGTDTTPTEFSTPTRTPEDSSTPNATPTESETDPSPETGTETDTPRSTPSPEAPGVLYVAPDGDEGNVGSQTAPLASLSTALSRAVPGTTVRLRGGTYRPNRTVGAQGLAGTADEPVVVEADPDSDERPVFDFAGATVGGMRFSDCHWLEMRGFGVQNAPSRGLFVERGSSDVLVEDVSVWASGGDPDASGIGVFVLDSREVTLRRVTSQNNYDPSSGGNNADGIGVERSPGTLVDSCVARGNSDDGFDLWQTTETTLRHCWSYDNGYDPDGSEAGDGDGFKLGGGDASGANVVRRCVAFDNRVRGFDDNGTTRPVTLYNCTAWRNPIDFRLGCRFDLTEPVCPTHRLRNNLSAGGEVQLTPFVDSVANSWDLDVETPGFASIDRDDDAFLHLTADSPAVDAGVDVGLSYRGGAPDLGAFEFEPPQTPTEQRP